MDTSADRRHSRKQEPALAALPPEDLGLPESGRLVHLTMERGGLLYDPGDPIDHVYFPHDGVISLMTLMENGAAIESATIGREGALGLMAAVAPRQSLSRAIVQTPLRAARIDADRLHEAWQKSAGPARPGRPPHRGAVRPRHPVGRLQRPAFGGGPVLPLAAHLPRPHLHRHRRADPGVPGRHAGRAAHDGDRGRPRSLQEKGVIRYRRGMVDIIDRAGLRP